MNSRGSWSVEGIEPSVRDRAEAAARRAGLSLEQWLNSAIGETDAQSPGAAPERAGGAMSTQRARDVAEIHQRLDLIGWQIEQITQPAEAGRPPVTRQFTDPISRLDERLSQTSSPASHAPPQAGVQATDAEEPPAAAHSGSSADSRSATDSTSALDLAVAEILARQGELERDRRHGDPQQNASSVDMPASAAEISGLERQLSRITRQIESLQPPEHIEQLIAALRAELADIRKAIIEAMPRNAIESIEHEIRQLARRIDANRHDGSDNQALSGVERALDEIHQTLRTLTPAEQLAGFDEAIRKLGGRLDTIVRAGDDPASLQELERAVAALRCIVANVASNEALARLTEQVHGLAAKVDQLSQSNDYGETFVALEQRIATLTTALQTRAPPAETQYSEQFEGALRTLSERLDRIPTGNDTASAFAHLEQRISYLLERLETSADHRASGLGRVEESLQDILRHLEHQQSQFASPAARSAEATPAPDNALTDSIKSELSDIRHAQTEADRHTQDALEAVHNTLGHVVDRLAAIESDLRIVQAASPSSAAPRAAPVRPELPNPAQAQHAAHAPAGPLSPFAKAVATEPPPGRATRMTDEAIEARSRTDGPAASWPRGERRAEPLPLPISTDLPPDHPLEPGTLPPGRARSPSERIAASESAISELPSVTSPKPAGASSFIAAARRAAQTAANAPAADKPKHAATLNQTIRAAAKASPITSRIRSLLVGASVVVIVLGSYKLAMTVLDGGARAPKPVAQHTTPPGVSDGKTEGAPNGLASMTSPTPLGRQSISGSTGGSAAVPDDAPAGSQADSTATATTPDVERPPGSVDITGSIPGPRSSGEEPAAAGDAKLQIPPSEYLPDGIGGPRLRSAALQGDPAAAYEVAVRFAEGKGVPANLDEAAKWYDRAARGGIVPAIFRLGTLYEKGVSVKKDVDAARRYYLTAAERGNAKAMHNLAVLDADGGGKGADYRSASQWFRNAAERGVADSQFNLGILYARGIGVEQNLALSFKWFSLAAAQGDADAGRKRDEVAKRLDAQALAAAKLAVQNFTPVKQPDDAVNVATPAGGWDAPVAKTTSASAPRTVRPH